MVYVFLFAMVNLGLGFALAVGLAQWQQRGTAGWLPGMRPPMFGDYPHVEPSGGTPAPEDPNEGALAGPGEPSLAADEAPSQEAPAEAAPEAKATVKEMEVLTTTKSAYELAVADLQNWTEQYDGRLAEIESRLHSGAPSPDPVVLESCLDCLRQSNEDLLKSRDGLSAKLEEASQEREDFRAFCRRVQEALHEQNTQIRQAGEILDALDCEARPEEGQKQLILETTKLLGANDHLRDVLSDTRTELARTELRDESAEAPTVNDRLTDLPNRASLEANLAGFWQKDPHRVRQLSLALVDLDQFGRVNERYGHPVGNRILRAVSQVLAGLGRDGPAVGRFSGQRFLVMMPDSDLREATSIIERIRQTVEISRFRHEDSDIRVTVSCGVVTATAQDTLEGILARAEATLQEAKRYGRNRSFVHEGKYPTPVVPPNFTLEEKTLPV